MTTKIINLFQTRLIVSLIVVLLCLFAAGAVLLQGIQSGGWQQQLITGYLPATAIAATCVYLIVLAIRVHSLEQKIAVVKSYDPLTHTLKASPLLAQARKLYKTVDLASQPISILCMQVDRTSAIEQEYSEEAASAVMREFGGTLIGATRENDLIGRVDEDTFVAVVLKTPAAFALPVVARVQELAHADVVLLADAEVRYSISVGYASSDQEATPPDFDTLFSRARSALEEARKDGPASVQGWIG